MKTCPFPGLLPFREEDAPYFFGRERDVEELFRRLDRNRFLAVVGVSGSGKSSLVRAGLVPELRFADTHWKIADLKPGAGPLAALARAAERQLPGPQWHELVSGSSYGLLDGVRQAGLQADQALLLIVDQFEEIFAYRRERLGSDHGEESDLFVQQLLRACSQTELPIYVLFTMRTDYLGQCSLFRNLAEALNDGTYLVPRLTRQGQDQAIRKPLAAAGVEIENCVADELLNTAEDHRDELPVLQHLLKRLWEEWTRRGAIGPVKRADYLATEGWEHAIGKDAENVFARFTDAEKYAAKLVFQRITERGISEQPIRRPRSLQELFALTKPWVSAKHLTDIVEALCDRDLLVCADGRIDLPHECVMWRWKRLQDWINEEFDDVQMLLFLTESARRENLLSGWTLAGAKALRVKIDGPWSKRYVGDTAALTRLIDASEEAEGSRLVGTVVKGVVQVGLAAWKKFTEVNDSQKVPADVIETHAVAPPSNQKCLAAPATDPNAKRGLKSIKPGRSPKKPVS